MTRDEAVAQLVMRWRLEPEDITDLEDAFAHEVLDPDGQLPVNGGVAALLRVYARQGTAPDLTSWQTLAADLAIAEEGAAKLAPLVGLIITLLPLL